MLATIAQGFKNYWELAISRLPIFITAIIAFLIFLALARIARASFDRFFKKFKIGGKQRFLIGYVINIIILFIGGIVFLSILGVNVMALVTGVGITGIIIGFALQDIFKNLVSGIIIFIQKPFQVGDQIIIGKKQGRVQEIKTRYTTLRTFDGNDIIIPNQVILNQTITCTTSFPKRRSEFTIKIDAENDINKAVKTGLEALNKTPGILKNPAPKVWLQEISLGRITLKFFFWWTTWQKKGETLPIKSRAIKNVKEYFEKEKIHF